MTAVFFTIEFNFIQLHSYLRCPKAFNNEQSLPAFMATTARQSFARGRSLGFGSLAVSDGLGVGTTRVEVLHSAAPSSPTGGNTDKPTGLGSYQSIKCSKIPFPLISLSNDTLGQFYKHHFAKFLCFVCFLSKMWANNILPWICCKGCLALIWLHQIFTAEEAEQNRAGRILPPWTVVMHHISEKPRVSYCLLIRAHPCISAKHIWVSKMKHPL